MLIFKNINITIILSLLFSTSLVFSDEVSDPFENLNRKTFEFNEKMDEKIAKPIAQTYSQLPPKIKKGVSNFFDNLEEVDTFVNQLLQGKPKESINDLEVCEKIVTLIDIK